MSAPLEPIHCICCGVYSGSPHYVFCPLYNPVPHMLRESIRLYGYRWPERKVARELVALQGVALL